MKPLAHMLAGRLLQKRVQVHLIGTGGNGAQIATCLARLDIAMRALGHPFGLHVTAVDPDAVSEANIGRQLFSPSDVGHNKAVVTVTRLNRYFGLDWHAVPSGVGEFWASSHRSSEADLVISCVDSRAARRLLHGWLATSSSPTYWMDLGNREADGQVVLGETRLSGHPSSKRYRLPCVTELFPQLLDATQSDDVVDSCSLPMSLASQGLFINDLVVRWAAQLLYELFSMGMLTSHGVVCNAATKRSAPIAVDLATWKRFGYDAKKSGSLSRLN